MKHYVTPGNFPNFLTYQVTALMHSHKLDSSHKALRSQLGSGKFLSQDASQKRCLHEPFPSPEGKMQQETLGDLEPLANGAELLLNGGILLPARNRQENVTAHYSQRSPIRGRIN